MYKEKSMNILNPSIGIPTSLKVQQKSTDDRALNVHEENH